jgi:hypothetical protein
VKPGAVGRVLAADLARIHVANLSGILIVPDAGEVVEVSDLCHGGDRQNIRAGSVLVLRLAGTMDLRVSTRASIARDGRKALGVELQAKLLEALDLVPENMTTVSNVALARDASAVSVVTPTVAGELAKGEMSGGSGLSSPTALLTDEKGGAGL